MTNWITLHGPRTKVRDYLEDGEVKTEWASAEPFHLRADIITEIVPAGTETVIRTSTGGQYVCGETAAQVLDLIANRHNVPPDQRRHIRAYNAVMPEAGWEP